MIEIIKKIFIEKNFEMRRDSLIDQEFYFFSKNDDTSFDFFVVLNSSIENMKTDVFEEWSDLLINKLIEQTSIPGIDKNLSMIILLRDVEEDTIINKRINDIEEDPYYFKKYVLTYTEEQKNQLYDLIAQNLIIPKISDFISDKTMFREFKRISGNTEESKNNLYNLISKLFIKLPFLKVPIKTDDLVNLSDIIYNQVTDKDKESLDLSLTIDFDDIELANIIKLVGGE